MASKRHAEIIKQWLDGAKIQYFDQATGEWKDPEQDQPGFYDHTEYRIKPAEPGRAPYPETQMSDDDLQKSGNWATQACMFRDVANAALRHARDAGQIVTREEFDRAVGDRTARDMAVAKAVADHAFSVVGYNRGDGDLAAIIAEVKP